MARINYDRLAGQLDRALDAVEENRQVAKDLEASTFQKRPCYRYIRHSDRVPPLAEGEAGGDGIARVKLFDPTGSWTWYISEYDPETRRAFGLVHGQDTELGYFDMAEIVDFRGQMGLPIERDLQWGPRPLSECS